MILDILKNSGQYLSQHRSFLQAFDFLKREDICALAPGRYEIDGENIFALVSDGIGKSEEEAKLEVHRKYIDIQYLISGVERIGWNPLQQCSSVISEYNPEKDIAFYSDHASFFLKLTPGMFAVFFPEDAHAPMISGEAVKKVVLKISLK